MPPWVVIEMPSAVTVAFEPFTAIPDDPAPFVRIAAPFDIVTLVVGPVVPAATPRALVPLVVIEPPEKVAVAPSYTSSPCDQLFASGTLLPLVDTATPEAWSAEPVPSINNP